LFDNFFASSTQAFRTTSFVFSQKTAFAQPEIPIKRESRVSIFSQLSIEEWI
jgi:hypothetical protein